MYPVIYFRDCGHAYDKQWRYLITKHVNNTKLMFSEMHTNAYLIKTIRKLFYPSK